MYPWFRQIAHVILNPGPGLDIYPRPRNYSPGTPLHTQIILEPCLKEL